MTTIQRTTVLLLAGLAGCSGERAGSRVDSAAVAALRIGPGDLGPSAARAAELRKRLGRDPYAYFRFINKRWSKAVCDSIAASGLTFVVTSLHGDAHVNQYAVTADQRGLDDFDDSARGPAVLDIVRFLASVELVLTAKGWGDHAEGAIETFVNGYRRAIVDSSYVPPEPAYVARQRSRTIPKEEFLAWAESLMEPFDEHARREHEEGARAFGEMMLRSRPELSPTYFALKRSGWLRIGIGSALTPKQLARMEGPTSAPDDDVILEAKQLSDLSDVECIEVADSSDAMRVIDGSRLVGRIRHDIIAIVPTLPGSGAAGRDWWVRSWAPSYVELDVKDLENADELLEIVHDVGAQLGRGHRAEAEDTPDLAEERLDRNEAWARREVKRQIRNLLEAWDTFRTHTLG